MNAHIIRTFVFSIGIILLSRGHAFKKMLGNYLSKVNICGRVLREAQFIFIIHMSPTR